MKLVCPECGREFEGRRKDMVCSPDCRKKRDMRRSRERHRRMHREQQDERQAVKDSGRRCPDCGKPITDYRCPECWARRGRPAASMGFEEYDL